MPSLTKQQRAQGGFADDAEPWPDHDWSVPTDAATLRHRVLPTLDQRARYGHATDSPVAKTRAQLDVMLRVREVAS